MICNEHGGSGEGDDGEKAIPEAVKRAMEKAKEYQKNKEVVSNDIRNVESANLPGTSIMFIVFSFVYIL